MLSRVSRLAPLPPVLSVCTQLDRTREAMLSCPNLWNCLGRLRNSSSTVVIRPYTLAQWCFLVGLELNLLLLRIRLNADFELKLLQLLIQLHLLLLLLKS